MLHDDTLSATDSYRRTLDQVAAQIKHYGDIAKWPMLSLLPGEASICACGHNRLKHPFDHEHRRGACSVKSCECSAFVMPRKDF